MLIRLQQHAWDRERRARQARAPRIVLFASDPVIRLGLVSLLSGATICVQGFATSEQALRSLLSTTRIQALVAVGQDRAVALTMAREFAVPVSLIVATHADAQLLQDLDVGAWSSPGVVRLRCMWVRRLKRSRAAIGGGRRRIWGGWGQRVKELRSK